jgi:hypothetical protein
MRTAPSRRVRVAAVLTTAAALGGLSLTAAPPASAVVLDPTSISHTSVDFDDDPAAGVTCTGTGTGNVADLPLVADGQPHSVSATADATDTNNADPTDVSTAHATAGRTATLTQAAGQLSHISFHDGFSATMSSTKGTAQKCNLSTLVGSTAQLKFDLVRPTYVTVKATSRGMIAEAVVANDMSALGGVPGPNSSLVAAISGGQHGTGEGHLLLPAGTAYIGINITESGATAPTSASGTADIDVSFDQPGLATSATTGDGKKYVDLPAADDCTTHAAVATWKAKAGKGKHLRVKKAVFKVDGVKVASVKKPKKKETTILRGLPAENAFTITGTLELVKGGTVTVTRDYQACS